MTLEYLYLFERKLPFGRCGARWTRWIGAKPRECILTTHRLQQAIGSIQKSSKEIVETPRGLSDEVLRWKPEENVWSIMEILCHVEEVAPYWTAELEAVVSHPGIEWGRGVQDPVRLAAVTRAPERSLGDVLNGIEQATKETVDLLARLKDEDLDIESPSRNPRFGVKPMSFIVDHMMVEHLEKHLRQMQRNVAQFSSPERVRPEAQV
jgi:hypothetical protein